MLSRSLVAGVALALVLAPGIALPQTPPPLDAPVDLGAPADRVDAQRDAWRERLKNAREDVARARARHDEALDTYSRMRHRLNKRGEAKAKILTELHDSEADLAASEAALRALLEEARNAGVPPGWLRPDSSDAPAAPQAGSAP